MSEENIKQEHNAQNTQKPTSPKEKQSPPKKRKFTFWYFAIACFAVGAVLGTLKKYACFNFTKHPAMFRTNFLSWRIMFADKDNYGDTYKPLPENQINRKDKAISDYIDLYQDGRGLFMHKFWQCFPRGQNKHFSLLNEWSERFYFFEKDMVDLVSTKGLEKFKKDNPDAEEQDYKFNVKNVDLSQDDIKSVLDKPEHKKVKAVFAGVAKLLIKIADPNSNLHRKVGKDIPDELCDEIRDIMAESPFSFDPKNFTNSDLKKIIEGFCIIDPDPYANFNYNLVQRLIFWVMFNSELEYYDNIQAKLDKAVADNDKKLKKKLEEELKKIKEDKKRKPMEIQKAVNLIVADIFEIHELDAYQNSDVPKYKKLIVKVFGPMKIQPKKLETAEANKEILLKDMENWLKDEEEPNVGDPTD
ncbi:hypothetical protein EDEG_03269 [Edhazardia aedis USNM 41457]|uniref:Uncharacterized protein n=1 Tax=Edhazardia aedis (strain USNM 41457) TaxID=1003232 RepID=J9D373_EDHAE|nr:hypothetical protein EDEG_03269 [Edhazardia aedis USNM 41457]|eukprot:EJW02286.1 hypothetical protein EDEG_03269 [Edhazardia aedis USNM 41457]